MIMCIFHKWVYVANTIALMKRGVTGRRYCKKCGRTFIKKPWYRGWAETAKIREEDKERLSIQ